MASPNSLQKNKCRKVKTLKGLRIVFARAFFRKRLRKTLLRESDTVLRDRKSCFQI